MTTTKIHKIPSFIPTHLAISWLEFLRETRQSIEFITNVCKGKKTVMVPNDGGWEILSETLDLDARSGNFDNELRKDTLRVRALDRAVTRAAVQPGKLIKVEVLDHLVAGGGRFVSIKERSLGFS